MGRTAGLRWTSLEHKEEILLQAEQNEETTIQHNEERLRNVQENLKCCNIRILAVAEGKKEEQYIEKFLEKRMMENFPNVALGRALQEAQEAQRVPDSCTEIETTRRNHNCITQDER